MALLEGDEDLGEGTVVPTTTPAPGTTTTPGGPAPGPTATPVVSRPPDPIPAASSVGPNISPLDQVMSAHSEAYLGRMRNIGAGGSVLTGITNVLSAGALGSYGLNARGSIERAIDAINKRRTGTDYNATVRVSDIWRNADDQISGLSDKIRLCDEMEVTIDNFIALNKTLVGTAAAVKAIPARAIKPIRKDVTTMWKKVKEYPVAQNTGKVTKRLGIGMGSALVVGATIGLSPLAAVVICGGLPIGIAAAIRKAKQDPDGTARNGMRKELEEARSIISTIRQDAEEKRDELLKQLEKKYPKEVTTQKNVQKYFTEDIKTLVSGKDAKKLLFEFGKLMQSIDTSRAIDNFMNIMKSMKKPDTTPKTDAFLPDTLTAVKQSLSALFSEKGIAYRLSANKSLGVLEAAGPEQIGALLKRISQLDKVVPQSGRKIQLTISGVTKEYYIKIVSPDADVILEEITDPIPKDDVCVRVIKDKKTDETIVVSEAYDVPTETLINELKNKKYDDLIGSADGEEVKKQKKLLDTAKEERLTVADYKNLWKILKVPPKDYEKKGLPELHAIATHSSSTFPKKMIDKQPEAELIAELKKKNNTDLITTGSQADMHRREQLLSAGQNGKLTVPQYKELWKALRPPPLNYKENGLPWISKIAADPTLADQTTHMHGRLPELLKREISVKTKNDLRNDGTPADIARWEKLFEDAQTVGLTTITECKELWNALRPDWVRNGLPLLQEIAEGPDPIHVIPDEVLIEEAKKKHDFDLMQGDASQNAQRKMLLHAAQNGRLSGDNYKKLFESFGRPTGGQIGLRYLKEIGEQPGNDFEKVAEPETVLKEKLRVELSSKSESALKSGSTAEVTRWKYLLNKAQTTGLDTVDEYKELWNALSPITEGRAGLVEIGKIVDAKNPDGTEATKFKQKQDKIGATDLLKLS